MYSKEEASKLRHQFWITFGKYMKPIPSAEGLPINWVNYKTGLKQVFFRMDVTQKEAVISIEITHSNSEIRKVYFEQFCAFKLLFDNSIGEEWVWEQDSINEQGNSFSRISKTLKPVNIFDQAHWPTLISFLKPRIVALDQFWVDVKPAFEAIG
ncbi:DUF4268 domain-containing protein [Pedobacter sp. Du54]|uniref:DUF4268 domain-containing protein n=1 Tax=Pedobacter anseongensis TaxID=3133439 RepID=UPI0030B58AD4